MFLLEKQNIFCNIVADLLLVHGDLSTLIQIYQVDCDPTSW